jgi:hypothetical protein
MNCCLCRRRGREERLPRGWRALGDAIFCGQCCRRRYRLRSITMAVVEPIGPASQELRAAIEESSIHVTTRDGVWEAKVAEGQPVIRVLIKNRWWELRLKSVSWSGGQRVAYEGIASGATAGELFFNRLPPGGGLLWKRSGRDPNDYSGIICRMVAWIPRGQMEDAKTPQAALLDRGSRLDLSVHQLDEIDIKDLRDAIRANQVSFPSQVPTFPKHDRPDLQRKFAQLYFGLGWNCGNIATRYRLVPARVRQILNTWKRRAVKTGYIQHIPPSEVMSQLAIVRTPLHTVVTADPTVGPRFVNAPFSDANRNLRMTHTRVELGRIAE